MSFLSQNDTNNFDYKLILNKPIPDIGIVYTSKSDIGRNLIASPICSLIIVYTLFSLKSTNTLTGTPPVFSRTEAIVEVMSFASASFALTL